MKRNVNSDCKNNFVMVLNDLFAICKWKIYISVPPHPFSLLLLILFSYIIFFFDYRNGTGYSISDINFENNLSGKE